MKNDFFLWILMVFVCTGWTVFYICSFANIDTYLLSLANSFKYESQPALSNIKLTRSVWKNKSFTGINEKETKRKNEERHEFSLHEKEFLKRYRTDFETNWCRLRHAKLDWRRYSAPCVETNWGIKNAGWRHKTLRTCASHSFIAKWDIRPSGEFSRVFIQSKTASNHTKNIGGDSWRIHIKGRSSVSATVFDHNNGVYEAIFLLMEAGLYQIEIYLDYTLCDGFKDPPVDWYKKGSYQGKNQPDGILKEDSPYLMEPFHNGKYIWIKVPEPKYSTYILRAMEKTRTKVFEKNQNSCGLSCPSLIYGGLGRWVDGTWKSFSQELQVKSKRHNRKGILWIYGDSVSKSFAENLVTGPYHETCGKTFKECKVTYSWVYNVKSLKSEEKLDGRDYDEEKVMAEINKVLDDKTVDKHSVIMLNWGIHFAAAVNFTNYKRLIDKFVETLKVKRNKGTFKGSVIWRTTTAIFRERFPHPHKDVRRFLTFPRIILYNAYAMSAMCRAGVDIIDVYPMTDSFPPGTVSKRDPVHYESRAMESIQALLYHF